MTPTHYRNRWLKQLTRYEKTSKRLLTAWFKNTANSIKFEELTPALYEDYIATAVGVQQMEPVMLELYRQVGTVHGVRVGKSLANSQKAFTIDDFEQWFEMNLPGWILESGFVYVIFEMKRTFARYLSNQVRMQVMMGKSFESAIAYLQKIIKSRDFYSSQIGRIVTTETVGAANLGAYKAAERSTGIIMNKMWISAQDNRVRRIINGEAFDHFEMHETTVGENELFSVPKRSGGYENIRFPGDPRGSISNRINCRCTFGYIPVRDNNGNLTWGRTEDSLTN